MKAISLHQPWASAIAFNSKRIETRSWRTQYRGPLAIHAAKRCNVTELICLSNCWNWRGALHPVLMNQNPNDNREFLHEMLPFGAIVAVCNLVECVSTNDFRQIELDLPRIPPGQHFARELYRWTERQMGDFSLGRYGWILEDIKPVDPPIPYKGRQRLFDVTL